MQTSSTLTLIMATKGMTLFMYFFSSGRAPNSLAITLLSGRVPLLLCTEPDNKTELTVEPDKQGRRQRRGLSHNSHDLLRQSGAKISLHRYTVDSCKATTVYEGLFLTL